MSPVEAPPIAQIDTPPKRAAERIRETARDLFYREGIRAVGVDEIVARAGVTKPSLYRAFASKDELAAAYLRDYDREFWARFDGAAAAHPDDPRAQLRTWLTGIGARAVKPAYRGCGLSNAAVEYPQAGHPARLVAQDNKRMLRQRLADLARRLGASEPDALGDGLMLLVEGAFVSGQLFGPGGPAGVIADAAEALIEAHLRHGVTSNGVAASTT